jgi:hypothetical protein
MTLHLGLSRAHRCHTGMEVAAPIQAIHQALHLAEEPDRVLAGVVVL